MKTPSDLSVQQRFVAQLSLKYGGQQSARITDSCSPPQKCLLKTSLKFLDLRKYWVQSKPFLNNGLKSGVVATESPTYRTPLTDCMQCCVCTL